jgi:hypothetical protein
MESRKVKQVLCGDWCQRERGGYKERDRRDVLEMQCTHSLLD